jgi:hypothetical protein
MTSELGLRYTGLACGRAKGYSTARIPIQGLLDLECAQPTLKQVYEKTLSGRIQLPG